MSVVCRQVEDSATGRSLVQRSPADCGVSECDPETSAMRRPRPLGTSSYEKKGEVKNNTENYTMRRFMDFTFQNKISWVIESWRKKWREWRGWRKSREWHEWRKCVLVGEKENTCKYIKVLVRKPEEKYCL